MKKIEKLIELKESILESYEWAIPLANKKNNPDEKVILSQIFELKDLFGNVFIL